MQKEATPFQLVHSAEISVKFSDIVGHDFVKEVLINNVSDSKKFSKYVKREAGILLYGATGVGKTELAKAFAKGSRQKKCKISGIG